MPGTGFKVPVLSSPTQLELSLDKSSFCIYDQAYPQIWIKFKELTLRTIGRGFKHYSAKGIFEILRWETGIDASGDCFKVNNNYTSYYARKFEKEFPQHDGFFRKRGSIFDL